MAAHPGDGLGAVAAVGFCMVGGQNVANAWVSLFYPVTARSTGLGWTLGVGRIGSVLGPVLTGVLIGNGVPSHALFRLCIIPSLVSAAALFLVRGPGDKPGGGRTAGWREAGRWSCRARLRRHTIDPKAGRTAKEPSCITEWKTAPMSSKSAGSVRSRCCYWRSGRLVLLSDGFDAQVLSVAGPDLAGAWHLGKGALAPVFAANLAGLMVGALLITPLTDLFSRKRVIASCIVAFGLLSLATVWTTTLPELESLRFVTGLALGAAMPSVIAAASEYVPRRHRTGIVVGLSCSFSLGSALSGIVASLFLARFGWVGMFVVGGIVPLLTLPLLLVCFPESPTFLMARGRRRELDALLRRMGPQLRILPGGAVRPGRQRFPVAGLFQEGRAPTTLCLWLTYFCSGATLYFLVNWLPILLTSAGFAPGVATLSTTAYQVGGITGGFLVGMVVDRFGAIALSLWLFAAAAGVAAVGGLAGSVTTILLASAMAGLLVVGGQNALNAFTGGKLYPSAFRATGLGWALSVLRLGGVLAGSLAAGFVVSLDLGPRNTFLIIAAPELLCGLGMLLIHLRRSALPMAPSVGEIA